MGFGSADSRRPASPFEQHPVSPTITHFADPLTTAHFSETQRFVQMNAGDILRQDSGLQRPNSRSF
jgi:hypothetical protein